MHSEVGMSRKRSLLGVLTGIGIPDRNVGNT